MRDITNPEIDTEASTPPVLSCPNCGENWLHQCGVDVFCRNSEDEEQGLHASVDYSGEVSIDGDTSTNSGNPSRRRDGIKIQFSCEQCSDSIEDTFELRIAQHKGNELIYWEGVSKAE